MAVLYVSEYAEAASATGTRMHIAQESSIAEQTVSISGSHAESSAFSNHTYFIRVHTDAICSINITSGGTAATTSMKRMAANATEYFGVKPGWKISVISNS